ncbi:spliceosome ATPase-activating subunit SPP2 [Aspergillus candidus]|uniref:Pre-mRNA-splicing factor n=1 Tax=Aspergillus candidus TaxID=41067 RepID=A0A2I2F1E4_ASPCN|nr:DExH-box splicing factor binding site-domain-containing protein [Aspergillus candidus]PLB34418.1 DExH-box splicing factor binding site-domain-containing protein [Aspergillus candidus]
MAYGLSLAQPGAAQQGEESGDGDRLMTDAEGPADGETPQAARKPLTQDEVALQALIRETQGDAGDARRSDLVIESTAGGDGRYDETTSFKADVAARPEPASLDQYNAIPVEDFGAALLRGMGWKEGQAVGRGKYGSNNAKAVGAPKVPERRPGFLGIGAKDASGGKGAEAELGAWGRAAMRKGSRKSGKEGEPNTEGVYMPVMMRNTQTGEFVTEEELSALQKDSKTKKADDDEWKERRDRNLEKSGRDRDRDSRRRRDDDYDDRSERKSSRRDRSRSSSDRHSRRRKYDDDDDDRYYRDRDDKDRDRRRDRDRDSDRDRERSHRYRDDDRYSSSRHSSKESSRHGRDRERDRDRGSDRDRDSHRRRRYDDR